ncbi:hypothetical protein ACFWFI_25850 [Streptomyces sp. NPDC060209]|uniref:hypothetical protein n=1 Tax=Streptomyces sp. NPDC060209 TaxID=3347073 RepID=UPI003655DA89
MKLIGRATMVTLFALGAAALGVGTASAQPGDATPFSIQCNNPVNLSLVDASGGASIIDRLIDVNPVAGQDANVQPAPTTWGGDGGEGGHASNGTLQSANNNRCGKSSDVDASTRIDKSKRVEVSKETYIDNSRRLLGLF